MLLITKNFEDSIGDNNYEDKMLKKSLLKSLNKATGYLIANTQIVFMQLKQVFIKVSNLQNFNL